MAGIAASIGDGAGSSGNGSHAVTRSSVTIAVKAPQWLREGKRPEAFIAV